jgi:tripartite-type tricarboxylate transporter receptor subunit TctC
LIVPIASGATLDTAARIVVPRFLEAIEQPAVTDNRVGVGGVMDTYQAAQAGQVKPFFP